MSGQPGMHTAKSRAKIAAAQRDRHAMAKAQGPYRVILEAMTAAERARRAGAASVTQIPETR